jgi:hypothetical protein
MAKYYVQSGTLRAIIDSADADRAALWAIHTAMQQVMPIDSGDELDSPSDPVLAKRIMLGETIHLSEIGFDRLDGLQIDTFEAFCHWNQLIQAVEKLEKILRG